MISVRNLTLDLQTPEGPRRVLNNISLEVADGEFISLKPGDIVITSNLDALHDGQLVDPVFATASLFISAVSCRVT